LQFEGFICVLSFCFSVNSNGFNYKVNIRNLTKSIPKSALAITSIRQYSSFQSQLQASYRAFSSVQSIPSHQLSAFISQCRHFSNGELPPLKKGEALKRFARDLTADAKAGKLDPGKVGSNF
jgi:ATP-dependent Clp protease ATP-binding subunit ClpA